MLEDRGQMTDDRGQKAEGRRQRIWQAAVSKFQQKVLRDEEAAKQKEIS